MQQARHLTSRTSVKLYLVRHGETEWSLSGQHTGRTDVALTARGENEARALEPALRAITFDRVLTSPAQRARRTCVLAGLGPTAEIEPDLAEWDYGDYEGQLSTNIREDRPGWSVYRDGCPGGETTYDVSRRADRVIARLRTLSGNVALFSHGQFGCSLAVRWIGLPVIQGQHLQLGTASLSVLAFNPSHPGLAVIAHWNTSPGAHDQLGRHCPASDESMSP
ncbi:MAG: histidine phosphatase family protein [Pseudomonadota bacterium]|nr:histidine phosphatase family protein [Pseudomonadota bacterium]